MGWLKELPMDQKINFISDFTRRTSNFTNLCKVYNISRRTGYKWVRRYEENGLEGLKERSRRPHNSPYSIPRHIKQAIISYRKKYKWGAKKLIVLLEKNHPDWDPPSRTSIHNILKKAGLTKKKSRRRYVVPMAKPFAKINKPNVVWTVDFKGQFKTMDGNYCYPLTVADAHSRYLLCCQGLSGTTYKDTKMAFSRLFKKYGLPDRIRSDNGIPFSSASIGGLSRLSIWWLHLGIHPERITPGKPQENGRHERMHRTLKHEAIATVGTNMRIQQYVFNKFKKRYNNERPHEALRFQTPSDIYEISRNRMPAKFPDIKYPSHFYPRLVHHNGCFMWDNCFVYVGGILTGEKVGIHSIDHDLWNVYFSYIRLGYFSENDIKKKGYISINRYKKV